MSETRENTGTLNKNLKKKTEKSPDYVGNVVVDGTPYVLVGWVNENRETKKKFISLVFNVDEGEQASYTPKSKNTKKAPAADLDDDDLPF